MSKEPWYFPDKLIVHHSLTKDSQTVSWGAIRKYHLSLGWADIGYHAGVELINDDYEVLWGRRWDIPGSHTTGQNSSSMGICFVGNYDEEEPTDKMLLTGAKVLAYWMKIYVIDADDIYPHSKFAPKTCPGTLFPMDKLREMAREIVIDD